MAAIKLFNIGELPNGTIRLQSQIPFIFGHTTADYILKDGKLHCYTRGDNGFDYYPTDIPYDIVTDKDEMNTQIL